MATTNASAAPSAAAAVPAASVPRGQVDLVDFIDWSGVECLNQDASHKIANALKQGYRDDEGLYLASDSDEQLLVHIPFMQVVKLHSALFKGPEEEGPKTVKLFSNKEHMGFSNVNDYPPSDSLDLSADHLVESKPVTLKYVKFQNVRSLNIFVEDNQSGSDVSKIQKITLYGTTVKIIKDAVSSEVEVTEDPEDPVWTEDDILIVPQKKKVEQPIHRVNQVV